MAAMSEREIVVRKLTELMEAYRAADYDVPCSLIERLLDILENWSYPALADVAAGVFGEPSLAVLDREIRDEEALIEACAAVRAVVAPYFCYPISDVDLTVMEIVGVFVALGWRLAS